MAEFLHFQWVSTDRGGMTNYVEVHYVDTERQRALDRIAELFADDNVTKITIQRLQER